MLLLILGLLGPVIVASGGFVVFLAGYRIRVTTVGNVLVAWFSVALVRWPSLSYLPYLAIDPWSGDRIAAASRHLVDGIAAAAEVFGRHRWLWCGALAALCLTAKLVIALGHPGFLLGDDVEIQEMTIGHLFRQRWPVWDLRSAFYPMAFVYPAQWLAHQVGVTDVRQLVGIGRVAVALISTCSVAVVFLIAQREYGRGVAVMASLLVATSGLLVGHGSAALPRPVSGLAVLLAYWCLMETPPWRVSAAGALLGIAAAMRFSEVVFVVPALLQLGLERRWRRSMFCALVCALTALGIQGLSDYFYWGMPFRSLDQALNYTLVQQLSSRGYQGAFFYLVHVTGWTDLFVAALAVTATLRWHWRPALWAWTPIVLLSLLPHKEPRYLVPVVPFVCLLAAVEFWRLATRRTSVGPRLPLSFSTDVILMTGLAASLLFQLAQFRVGWSDDAVALARRLDTVHPESVAAEQPWRLGGHLYLPSVHELHDLSPDDLQDGGVLTATVRATSPAYVVLLRTTCDRLHCQEALGSLGYSEEAPSASYRVFGRLR